MESIIIDNINPKNAQDHQPTKSSFAVVGMTCASCAISVESMLKHVAGVKDAGVNYANQSAWVVHNPSVLIADLQRAIQSIGYDLLVEGDDTLEQQETFQQNQYSSLKQRTVGAIALSLPVVVIGMFFMTMPYANWIMLAFSIPVVFVFGRSFFINAFKQTIHRKANMDTLVALSTGIAFLFSLFNTLHPEFWHNRGLHAHVYYEAATVIIAFISLGKLLEERAKANTSSAIKKLMGMQPKTLRILKNGTELEIDAASVLAGDTIIIKPGEKIPVDGLVSDGTSFVDESMISGEPMAVIKQQGEHVYAGTINQKGSFHFIAEKVGGDTLLAQIIKVVKEAQGSKAPVQKLVDKIAGVFVPVVIGLAILTFFIWLFFGGKDAFTHALLTAVTVLVIACPCALGLATPTAIMVGVGKGADNNILIRDAESLELMHKVNAIILDKTGTLTKGNPIVSNFEWLFEGDISYYKSIMYTIELRSEHPLALAIVSYLKDGYYPSLRLDHFESITGAGAVGHHANKKYVIGNAELLKQHNISFDEKAVKLTKQWHWQAKTVVYFAENQLVLACIAVADQVKETSAEAVSRLKTMGKEVYMLTGDNIHTARAVAKEVGIVNYKASMLPSDKASFVKELQLKNKVVAMVGDGINDSEALAQADVSIAMGRGSDIAMDVAKMTLITSDLNSIPKALRLSNSTVKTIRQNLFWAFIYNIIGIPIAAGILYPINGFLLDPMLAGAAMALSSVSVVSNSLRLKMKKI